MDEQDALFEGVEVLGILMGGNQPENTFVDRSLATAAILLQAANNLEAWKKVNGGQLIFQLDQLLIQVLRMINQFL